MPRSLLAQPAPSPCDAWEVEYATSGNLQLSDTPMGQGDGIYAIGPGRLVLRFEDRAGRPGGRAKMLSYEMRENFTVVSRTLFWKTTVVTETTTRATPDKCGIVAQGVLAGAAVRWHSAVFRTDGTLDCSGAFCGQFGAPQPGRSGLHMGPNAAQLEPFQFSADLKTLTMQSSFVSKTDMPKQTAHLALAGREKHRACVVAPTCL
jgi:hypothetical protein